MKLCEENPNFEKGSDVIGGRNGKFLEKPDIIDKFCRREIPKGDPELEELSAIQFAKMYDPIRRNKSFQEENGFDDDINIDSTRTHESETELCNSDSSEDNDPWEDEEDRVANYFITTNPKYDYVRLPRFIKLKDPQEGEVPIYEKRTYPKAARIHKKRQDNDPHRFFLSELMMYTGYTDEEQLGCDDEKKCCELYLKKKDAIQNVKMHMMPFTDGVDEARHYVEEAMKDDRAKPNDMGDVLDPEQEKEIEDCQNSADLLHEDFLQVNPDDLEIEKNLVQVKRTLLLFTVTIQE